MKMNETYRLTTDVNFNGYEQHSGDSILALPTVEGLKSKIYADEFLMILKSLDAYRNSNQDNNEIFSLLDVIEDEHIVIGHMSKICMASKVSKKNTCTLSNTFIKKNAALSDKCKYKLQFAICLNGYWGLFSPEFLEAKNGTLRISDFLGELSNSNFDKELSTCSYMFEGEIKIKRFYSAKKSNGLSIHHNYFGELLGYEFYYENELIFKVETIDNLYYPFLFVLQSLQEAAGIVSQTIEQVSESTIVTDCSKGLEYLLIPEYKFILPTKNKVYFPVNIVRDVLSQLVLLGVEIIVFRDEHGYTFNNFSSLFWK